VVSQVPVPGPVTAGDGVTYTVIVSNIGPDSAVNVVLTDTLPSSVTFGSATPGQGACIEAGGVVTCSLGDIPLNSNVSIDLLVTTTTAGVITNSASASSATADPDLGNNSASQDTTVDPAPPPPPTASANLTVNQVALTDPVTVGNVASYVIQVSNTGPDSAVNVVLTDTLPGSVTFGSATPGQGTCSEAGGVVTCNLGTIAINASVNVQVNMTTTVAGVITNSVSVSSDASDPNPANNTSNLSITVN